VSPYPEPHDVDQDPSYREEPEPPETTPTPGDAPSELADVLERVEARAGLLRACGDVRNSPTERELWLACKDAAPVLADAARLLRELAADFESAAKRSEAQDKLLAAYRIGRSPAEAAFKTLEKYGREWLDAARAKWRLP
jgi:hypothetical protein